MKQIKLTPAQDYAKRIVCALDRLMSEPENAELANGRDCYWWDEFIYNPSKVWKGAFRKK